MLQELSIKNFAIIDDLNITFSSGLTVLSGETGAGKSIIISAVNLLLGSRASSKLIRSGAETAELEALFKISPGSHVARMMDQHGYEIEDGLLVRRIISRANRHKIFINGRLATMHILNAMTGNLASISGQHAHQNLLKEDLHLYVIDQFGGLMDLRKHVLNQYHKILPMIEKLNTLKTAEGRQAEQTELLEFQKAEISAAGLSPGEDAALEHEKIRLRNAETLYQTAYSGIEELYSSQGSVIENLGEIKKSLGLGLRIDSEFAPMMEIIDNAAFQLEDLVDQLRAYLTRIQIDEKRLEAVEERLDLINKMKRKYGAAIEDVIAYLKKINNELTKIENLSDQIKDTEARLASEHGELEEATRQLSKKRSETAGVLAKAVESELSTLKMQKTRFQVSLQHLAAGDHVAPYLVADRYMISETGIDRAEFMIAPNVGEALKPLTGIASGGELSRIVLAIKAILATTDAVETIVFDEVDAGIGGSVAEVVGQKLASLSAHHQIICITHLPQIAKFGDHHFSIQKHVVDGRTVTTITPINETERINEIARMLGGIKITPATLDHAREMLKNVR